MGRMEPMKPMAPMKSFAAAEKWWPGNLGEPSAAGAQDGMRYAFFPDHRRLLVERDGTVSTYDSGKHRISGAAQASGGGGDKGELRFETESGPVSLDSLKRAP